MGPYQRTPKEVARATRSSGLGVRSVGPVGDFLDFSMLFGKHDDKMISPDAPNVWIIYLHER